jgi:hypothetical protein
LLDSVAIHEFRDESGLVIFNNVTGETIVLECLKSDLRSLIHNTENDVVFSVNESLIINELNKLGLLQDVKSILNA